MLNLFIDNCNSSNIVKDIEEYFLTVKITGTEEERALIKGIDNGEYLDQNSFIDRFGFKLYISELSTGCKAALCVSSNKDLVFDLSECGKNAVDEIIKTCKNGNILVHELNSTINNYDRDSIDVKLDNYEFTSIDRLNTFIFSERPFDPDMSTGGIKQCLD